MITSKEDRYNRITMLDEFKDHMQELNHKRVAIVGLGGLGGLCSYLLLGGGILKFHLSDSDIVDITNVHRQILFNEESVGESKMAKAISELKALDKRVEIKSFPLITEDNFADFVQDCDVVLDLSDNIPTRLLLSRKCLEYGIDFIHTSVAAFRGIMMVMPYSDKAFVAKHGCYQCMTGPISPLPKMGITGPSAAMMASACAQTTLLYLTNNFSHIGHAFFYDLKNMQINKVRLQRDCACPICGGKDAD